MNLFKKVIDIFVSFILSVGAVALFSVIYYGPGNPFSNVSFEMAVMGCFLAFPCILSWLKTD